MTNYATKEDVKQIVGEAVTELAGIISDLATNMDQRFEVVDKRFEQVDKRFENIEGRVTSIESRLGSVEIRIGSVEKKIISVADRLEAVENDIHDIYLMISSKQDKRPIKKLKGKELEQYVLETYNNLIYIAKEEGIKLPS